MKRIKTLNLGTKRLLLIISIIVSLMFSALAFLNVNTKAVNATYDYLIVIGYCVVFAVGSFLVFWGVVWLILWILDGYRK